MSAEVEDTYAEAFRSIFAEVLITARDRKWLDAAVAACTGNASSTILCDCEAGLDRHIGPGGDETFATPDGRPGAVVQFHVPRFRKDRVEALYRSLLVRLSQNVLTCPTAACFAVEPVGDGDDSLAMGEKCSYFGDGHQLREQRHGRDCWVVPVLGGEFVMEHAIPYRDGLMGGNLWLMGDSIDSALDAAERGLAASMQVAGVAAPFPGGITHSGSKAGSRYSFTVASTFAEFCPTLRSRAGVRSRLPEGVRSVMEIIWDGTTLEQLAAATHAAIDAAVDSPGLIRISAGNYGGRLGKSFVHLRPQDETT